VPVTRWRWLAAGGVLVVAGAAALALLGSAPVMPSAFTNPLSRFLEPGVAVWWLVLGGPFRSAPASAAGIAFAAAANAALWLLALWLVVVAARAAREYRTR
jgi:hypothetical protein